MHPLHFQRSLTRGAAGCSRHLVTDLPYDALEFIDPDKFRVVLDRRPLRGQVHASLAHPRQPLQRALHSSHARGAMHPLDFQRLFRWTGRAVLCRCHCDGPITAVLHSFLVLCLQES